MGYHKPALLHESIDGLNIKPKGIYVDLTFGGGGHSREVLKKLGKNGRLVAFDQDQDAEANVPDDKRIIFVGANFRYLRNYLRYYAIEKVDGILADLGISSHQIDRPERGFSFKSDAALDMRMDVRSSKTASQVLNKYSRDDLVKIFRAYGELGNAKALADAVTKSRMEGTLATTGDLERTLQRFIPKGHPSKFLARVYQALRIEVNREMDSLREMLLQTAGCLDEGGRLVVITYHSIEDRMVKNYMRSGNLEGTIQKDFYGRVETPWKLVNRSVIIPSREELEVNNRARSAKLRIAERIK
ncbi:MAG: 16S rRNA (cytosine(1402)-N(4))-methyltransferase RsmH [Bacteroidales bacterium]|nr:16S rRNA (cytosine(1402)-N(4))-methyltransferase RsmH [Bacteroidales bacterium]